MITQKNIRSILPGKIARLVMLMAEKRGIPNMVALREFYSSSIYRELEREDTKYWWMSPEQLSDLAVENRKQV